MHDTQQYVARSSYYCVTEVGVRIRFIDWLVSGYSPPVIFVSVCQTDLMALESRHISRFLCSSAFMFYTIQYKNDFYSAVIKSAEALVGRL